MFLFVGLPKIFFKNSLYWRSKESWLIFFYVVIFCVDCGCRLPISGEVRFTFSTFVLLNSETGLSIACIFYLFVFLLLNIFFSLCCSLFCVLSRVCVYVWVLHCRTERGGRGRQFICYPNKLPHFHLRYF